MSMINTKVILTNFKGDPMKTEDDTPLTVGVALSNILLMSDTTSKMKFFIIAKRLYEEETVTVDKADVDLMKKEIEKTNSYSILVTGQLLLLLDDIKDKK